MRSMSYAALVLAVCLATASCGDAEPAGRAAAHGGLSTPPEGHRWVGDEGVVVAVPDWWTTGDTHCLLPVEDTVFVESGAIADCEWGNVTPYNHLEVSSLAVIDADSAHGDLMTRELMPDGTVGGEEVLTGEECRWFAKGCRNLVALPGRGVVFALYVAEDGDVDPSVVRDSLMLLPDGWTTVPLSVADDGFIPTWGAPPSLVRRYAGALEDAGLGLRVEEAEVPTDDATFHVADLPKGSLLGIEPTPGSPIREGGEVTLTVMPAVPR